MKQAFPDGQVVYRYAETRTIHTTKPNGDSSACSGAPLSLTFAVIEFPNGQKESHFSDGSKRIVFPDGTLKFSYPNGEEESIFKDGTVQRLLTNGRREVEFVNGQKVRRAWCIHPLTLQEILFPDGTRHRVFPDKTVRVIKSDGSTETRYPDGESSLIYLQQPR